MRDQPVVTYIYKGSVYSITYIVSIIGLGWLARDVMADKVIRNPKERNGLFPCVMAAKKYIRSQVPQED